MHDPKEVEAAARAICALNCLDCGQVHKCGDGWRAASTDAQAALTALAPFRAAEREALQSELAAVTAERDAMRAFANYADHHKGCATRRSLVGACNCGLEKARAALAAALAGKAGV